MRKSILGFVVLCLVVAGVWFQATVTQAVAVGENFDQVAEGSYGSQLATNVNIVAVDAGADLTVLTTTDASIQADNGLFAGHVVSDVNFITTGISIEAVGSMGISSFLLYMEMGHGFAVKGYAAGVEVTSGDSVSLVDAGVTPYVDVYGSGTRYVLAGDAWRSADRVVIAFDAGVAWFLDDVRYGEVIASPMPSVMPTASQGPSATPEPIPVATPTPTLSPSPEPSVVPSSTPTPPSVAVVYVPPSVFETYVHIPESAPVKEPVPTPSVTPVPEATPIPEPVVVSAPEPVIEPVAPVFKDVVGHWAAESIGKLQGMGIVRGDIDGAFYPERMTTRNEFVVMVLRVMGMEDVGWHDVMDKAVREGLIASNRNGYRESEGMSREEAFTVLGRAYGRLGVVDEGDDENPYVYLYRFGDYWKVSAWARPSVGMGVRLGLIRGSGDKLDAKKAMSRAEMAIILDRLIEKMDKNRK
jgi:hypothetical protein